MGPWNNHKNRLYIYSTKKVLIPKLKKDARLSVVNLELLQFSLGEIRDYISQNLLLCKCSGFRGGQVRGTLMKFKRQREVEVIGL